MILERKTILNSLNKKNKKKKKIKLRNMQDLTIFT